MPETDSKALPAPVFWAQRSNSVYVRIAVEDCLSPNIMVEKDKITYKGRNATTKQDYEANLVLSDEIKLEDSKWINRDRGAEFMLIKAKEGPYWKRLLKDGQKYHWLKVDFNKWKDEDDSDHESEAPGGGGGDFEEMMRQMGGLGGMGGPNVPDMSDLDEKEDADAGADSDDDELPELEDK